MSLSEVQPRRGRVALAIVAGVLALAVAGPAIARPGHGARDREPLGGLERGLSRLELSAETDQAVSAVLDEARPGLRTLQEQIRDAQRAMHAQLEADEVDETALLERVDAIGALKTEARKAELRALLKVRALLSPEERARLEEMREKRHPFRHKGGPRGGAGETGA